MTNVLMSIKKKWWTKILNHQKTLEIRKTGPNVAGPYRVFIYVSGTGKVFGVLDVDEVMKGTPEEIYDAGGSALTLEQLKEYADGKPLYAWHITKVTLLRTPVALTTRPPMSWCYLAREIPVEQPSEPNVPQNTYAVSLKGGYGEKIVVAKSASAAKYEAYLDYDLTGGLGFLEYLKWVEGVRLLHRFKPSDLFGDEKAFEIMKKSRQIPFAKMGGRVMLRSLADGNKMGTIVGAGIGYNLQVCFDGKTFAENCHPHHRLTYFGANGEVLAAY